MVENIVNVRLGIGVSLPNGREQSMSGWALVYHCPMVDNIVDIMGGHWCIIAQL